MTDKGKTIAAATAALVLGFAGGVAGSALHPGPRGVQGSIGAVGPVGPEGTAVYSHVNCALQASVAPVTGSIQMLVNLGEYYVYVSCQ